MASRRIATKLGEASFKAPTFATSDGVSIDVGFIQSEAAAIDEICPIFPKRLDLFRWRWFLSLDARAPCRQQSLKVGELPTYPRARTS
jgi:hypothetical protein